jgi:hypothetical protein
MPHLGETDNIGEHCKNKRNCRTWRIKQQWLTFAKTNKTAKHGLLNNNGEHLQKQTKLLAKENLFRDNSLFLRIFKLLNSNGTKTNKSSSFHKIYLLLLFQRMSLWPELKVAKF